MKGLVMVTVSDSFRSFILFFALLLTWAIPVPAASSVADTTMERLMKQANYREICKLVKSRLEQNPNLDPDLVLYYKNRQSIAQLRLRNIDSAMIIARECLLLTKDSHDSTLIVDAWKAASYAYNNAGNLDSALYFTRLMMQYGERKGDLAMTRNAIVSMATILSQNRKFEQALHQYRVACSLTFRLNDTANFSTCLYNLGLTFLNLKMADSCLWYLNKAAEYATARNQNDYLIYVYGTIADCYLMMKVEKERKKYLLLANDIAEKIGNKQFLAMGNSNLLQGELESGHYSEAVGYGVKALELLKEQPYPVLKMKVDSMLSVAYRNLGNYSQAYLYFETFAKEREQLVGERQNRQLNELMVSLEVREKDLTIANQKIDLTRKQRNMQVLILVIIIVLILAGVQFYIIIRSRQFRRELFRKEKELEKEIIDVRFWMEWRQMKNLENQSGTPKSNDEGALVVEKVTPHLQVNLYTELREVFDKQKLYLDPELNIKTVIKVLGTNQKYLYQAISANSEDNFRSFLNRYRIGEAKKIIEQKIRDKEAFSLTEAYSYAGFNSHVSFYRAFKTVTGLTPKEYVAEIRNILKKEAQLTTG